MMFPIATVPPNFVFEHSSSDQAVSVAALSSRNTSAVAPTFSGVGVTSWKNVSQAISNTDSAWSLAISHSALGLRALKPGWDGPGSVSISIQTLFRAETLVREALEGRFEASAPYLVPAGDGSVQIEWHERGGEIELFIDPDGSMYLWGRSHVSGHEFEGEGEKALALFFRWAARLASESHNAIDVSPQKNAVALIAA